MDLETKTPKFSMGFMSVELTTMWSGVIILILFHLVEDKPYRFRT